MSHERVEPGSPGTLFDPELTYMKLHNNLRAHNTNPDARKPYTGDPYVCTGSAHLGGEHIRCTSPAHSRLAMAAELGTMPAAPSSTVALVSPTGSRIVSGNGYCHVCGDSLIRPDNAPETAVLLSLSDGALLCLMEAKPRAGAR